MDRIISLKLQLKGDQTTLKQLNSVTLPLQEAGKLLQDLKTKSVSLDVATQKVKSLTQSMQALNKELEKAGRTYQTTFGGSTKTTGSASTPKLPAAPKATNSQSAIRAELATLDAESARYKELIALVVQYKQKQAEVTAEIKRQAKEFEATKFAVGSYKDLNAQLVKARNAYKELSEAERKGTQGKALLGNITQLDTKLKQIDASIGQYQRNVGGYTKALQGIGSIVGQYFSATALLAAGQQIIQQNAEISDSIADVAKTANATIPEIEKLAEQLKFRDTRTSLADQLKIAEIGGQLGETADSLASFTAAIDVLGVALGDEFGNDVGRVTKEVAGLRNTLGDFKTDNAAEDILRLGNALNVLSANGNATAGVTTDIASRLAGLGTAFGLTTGQIIGLASRLDELNIPAERAGGSIQRVFNEIAKSPEKFAALSGKTIPEFTKLVNEDLVGAFTLILDNIGKSNAKTTQFADILEKTGLKGIGAIEVFSKLGQNTDALRASIDLATTSLENTNSVYDEFTKKNNTLGAELAKLKNTFVNFFTNSSFADGLATVIKYFRELLPLIASSVTVFTAPFQTLKGLKDSFFGAAEGVDALANSTEKLTSKLTKGFKNSLDSLKKYADEKGVIEKEETQLTAEQIQERLDAQKEAQEKAKAAAREARAEEKRQREQEQRDILEAAKNIQRLQLEDLDKNFEGRRERAKKEGEIAIAALVGTPEQVATQTELIGAQVARSIEEINKDFKQAREKTLQEIEAFRQEITTGNADFQLFGAEREVSAITRFYESQVEQLRLTRAKQFAELEKSFAKGELTANEFEQKRIANEQQFSQKRIDLQKLENAELAVAEANLLQKQLAERETAFQKELAQIKQQKEERAKALGLQVESGAITPSEGTTAIQSAAALARSQELEAEQKFLEDKDKLQADFAAKQIERQIDTVEQETELQKNKTEKLLEIQRQYQQSLANSLNDLSAAFGEFITGQEKDSKQFLKNILTVALDALEKLILIQVAAATAQSFAQPDSVATFGATGAARAAIISGLITAGFSALKAAVQSFEHGGAIPGTGASGEGEAQGASHASGGIKTTIGGKRVEIEGKEHILRNGNETYIINKKSSSHFRQELKALHGNTAVFDPRKRAIAEQINMFKGFGRAFAPVRKFAEGGALSISPLGAPVLPSFQNDTTEQLKVLTDGIFASIAATNARIDRLVVVADPLELAKKGAEKANVKVARSL